MNTFPKNRIKYCDKPHFTIKAFAGDNIDDLLNWYEKMIQLNPDNKDLYFGKADLLSQKKNYEEAIAALDQLIALDSSDAQAWFKKGEVLYEMGVDREALECYKKVVSITSLFEEAWSRIGEILLNLDDYKQAKNVFQHIIDLDPENNNALRVLMMLDEYFARSEHPEDYLIMPQKKDKTEIEDDVDSELDRLVESPLKEPAKPVDYDEQDMDPADIASASKELVLKGKELQSQGDFIQALRSYNKALELNPLCWDAWKAKGDLFLEIGKTDKASFCYYKAMHLALTPISEDQEGDVITTTSRYNEWRNKFFSSMDDPQKESEDT